MDGKIETWDIRTGRCVMTMGRAMPVANGPCPLGWSTPIPFRQAGEIRWLASGPVPESLAREVAAIVAASTTPEEVREALRARTTPEEWRALYT